MSAIQNDYLEDFLQIVRNGTEEIVLDKAMVELIQKSISQWLITKEKLDRKLYIQYAKLEKDKNFEFIQKGDKSVSSANLRKVLNAYSEQRRHIRNLREVEDVTNHFKKGYELIHRIREIITKQDITYTILFAGDKTREQLMEAHLTLDQLLPRVSLSLSSDTKIFQELSNAISLSISNSAIKQTVDSLLGEKENNLQQVVSAIDNPNLWNSLVDYRDKKMSEGMDKAVVNFGRIYEVYSILRRVEKYKTISFIGHTPGSANTENLANALLDDAIKNSDPGWQIGDVGLEQLKSVFNANATLISASTIETVLRETQEAFKKTSKNEMSQNLKKIFTTQKTSFNNKIDEKVEEEAIKAIDETISKIQFD